MAGPAAQRPLGRSGLAISQLGFGAAPLGGLFRASSAAESLTAIAAAIEAGLTFVDTAPLYGLGLSERRVGDALREIGRERVVLSSKVGRVLRRPGPGRVPTATQFEGALPFEVVFDYGYDGVMRSFEDSLQRLGTDRIDILLVHDINRKYHGDRIADRLRELAGGGYRALDQLRREGSVRAIGAGINDLAVLTELIGGGDYDCIMLPGRLTLLDASALDTFVPLCRERGVAILAAAPFESGILATGAVPGATFNYGPASPDVRDRVGRLESVCRSHGVPLAAAALNYALRCPAVASVVTGMRSADEVRRNTKLMSVEVPDELWRELEETGLAPDPAVAGRGEGARGRADPTA